MKIYKTSSSEVYEELGKSQSGLNIDDTFGIIKGSPGLLKGKELDKLSDEKVKEI